MRRLIPVLLTLVFAAAITSSARAATPLYAIKAMWGDTYLQPGGPGQFVLQVRNVGEAQPSAPLTISDQLPSGVIITNVGWHEWMRDGWHAPNLANSFCTGTGTATLSCTISASEAVELGAEPPGILYPQGEPARQDGEAAWPTGYLPSIYVDVAVNGHTSGTETNTATVSGGGATATVSDVDPVSFAKGPTPFGVVPGSFQADFFDAAFPAGSPVRQAGSHPFEYRTNFDLNEKTGYFESPGGYGFVSPGRYINPVGSLRTTEVTLPRGMVGDPEAVPKCDPVDFASEGATANSTACPSDTQVGYLNISMAEPDANAGAHGEGGFFYFRGAFLTHVAIYNLTPPKGQAVDFAFNAGGQVEGHIYPSLDPAQGYAIKTVAPDTSDLVLVRGTEVTIWGAPGDSAHDKLRYYPHVEVINGEERAAGAPWGSAPIKPLLTMPADCGVANGGTRLSVDSYEDPDVFTPVQEVTPVEVTGCNDARFHFEPDVRLTPTDRHGGAPTGLDVHLDVPQRNDEAQNASELYAQSGAAKAIATPPIKRTVVRLPQGMTISPSAGQGLGACSSAQIGLGTNEPVRCPESSQIGTLTVHTPILPADAPMHGAVYIAAPGDNPFHNMFAMYLVIEEPERGILVKLAGRIDLDPVTGQITTTFDDLPQVPVSAIDLAFKGGGRAALVNPLTCGKKTMTAEFFTWQDPTTPHVVPDSYYVTQKPDGSPCVNSPGERPFAPRLTAGTLNPTAGSFSPFTFSLTRSDEDQELSRLAVTLPPGVTARLTGVSECPEAGIAHAQDPALTGQQELAEPSCPASSQIGTTFVGAGVGATLTYVPGKVYFAGPYNGAPFSIVVITPTLVGPYDLGVVAVRSALYIDPHTAQVEVVSDPLPQIFDGIPVRIRDVRVSIERPEFTVNPTSCRELNVAAQVFGTGNDASIVADDVAFGAGERFQAANCAKLAFDPSFKAFTSGKTSRAGGASLTVKLAYPQAPAGTQANIASVKVSLPKQLPSRLSTLQKACPDNVFSANPAACPLPSRVGMATALTPILPVPLAGPAYFVSHGNARFPELVIVLQGDGVTVQLDGETFISKTGVTSSTFRSIPDEPVTSFQLTLPQGPNSALAANGSLCARALTMPTSFTAQNGAVVQQKVAVTAMGCTKKRRTHKTRRHRAHGKQ